MENIETLLAAVAQTQGFDNDEPVVSTGSEPPKLENPAISPGTRGDVGGSQPVGAPMEVFVDARSCAVVNPPPEMMVPAGLQVIGTVEKRKRGRPPKGQLAAKPGPPKRKKQEQEPEAEAEAEEEEDVCFICFDGGSLVLCDRKGCPKAYHPACIKRDEAFFKSKAKWNCGWHICSVCCKASHYMCYTCPYSLCKGCSKDADYLCVRGNKGFCTTCMKTIMLIEQKDQASNDSAVQVDFDDITCWEYLFKMYWVLLKEKLSLTMKELIHAEKPRKGIAPVVCKPHSSNVCHTTIGGMVSIPNRCLEHLEMSKLQDVRNDRLATAQSTIHNHIHDHIQKLNCNNAEAGPILSKDSKNENTDEPIITSEPSTNKPVSEKAGSIEETAEPGSIDKRHIDHIEKLKLPESHILVEEGSLKNSFSKSGNVGSFEVDGNNSGQLIGINRRKREACKRREEKATQNNLSRYAAINVHNMNLIYLQRNPMENLIEDKENFQDKVVGSIVRIRISSDDQKPDVYRLVQVVGICKVAKPYKIGDKTADIMLEVLNLGKKEVIQIDAISNQEFTEAECRLLDQYIKCGLLKQYTLDEVQRKAMALQSVRYKNWLEAEMLQLYHLLDQASKKGREEEVSEYVLKIQLLKSPEEHQHRISEVPEVHSDTEIGADYESEDARSSGNSMKDVNDSPRYSESPRHRKTTISPNKKGKEEGSTLAQSRMMQNIDASKSHGLEKQMNQVNITNSAIGGRNDQAMLRSELEASTAAVSFANSLTDDNVEIRKLWHYRDSNGKIRGPFSMMHLRMWSTTGQLPPDMRIWTNHELFDSLLLSDALNGKFHGASELQHNISSKSKRYSVTGEIRENKSINSNSGDNKQTDAASCGNASVFSENNCGSTRVNESSWPKCWDLFRDKSPSAHDVPASRSIPSSSLGQISFATDLVGETDDFNHVSQSTEKNLSCPNRNEMTCGYELQNKSTHRSQTAQSSEEKLIPLPIGLSLNDIDPESVSAPVSISPNSTKQNADMDVSNLPSPKHWGAPTSEKHQSVSSNVRMENSGILDLLSPKPRTNNEDREGQAIDSKQSGSINDPARNLCPSWSSALNMMVGGAQLPDWCGYSATPAKHSVQVWDSDNASASSLKPPEATSGNVVNPDSDVTHVSPSHRTSNLPDWLAIINEPIEFDALGEESVSDLLAEVDAMESQGALPSPTSAMKFAKELIQDCKDDCFSSIEEFSPTPDPGKGESLRSTGEIQLSCLSSFPCKPVGSSPADALDSFSKSGVRSSGSSTGETSASVYTGEAGSESLPPASNMRQDMVGATIPPGIEPETTDPGWGNVQGNINLVTVRGNVNLVLGGPGQGMANLGCETNQGTWGNPNINLSPINGSLPWDGQRKHSGERFNSPREWGYQNADPGFGRVRPPWGRLPYSGGGYSRPLPKGQRVCKFYESGHCKKGAFCDYLHP